MRAHRLRWITFGLVFLIFQIAAIVWLTAKIFNAKDNEELTYRHDFEKTHQPVLNQDSIKNAKMNAQLAALIEREKAYELSKSYENVKLPEGNIYIAVTGVDSRMGESCKHADANHLISIDIKSGRVVIISVPRDTPADAGLDDTTGQNKLTVVRAVKGRSGYFEELEKITGAPRIDYYVEFGFSQAMGLLDFLGYKPHSTLQVLRSRTGLGGDDFQRVYNQANFIRQIARKFMNEHKGLLGDLALRGALNLVETNLTFKACNEIRKQLEDHGWDPNTIEIAVKPLTGINFKNYNFTNLQQIDSLVSKIERFNQSRHKDDSTETKSYDPYSRLNGILSKAERDTANPVSVIHLLTPYYQQHAWLQIDKRKERDEIRSKFGNLLSSAYRKRKDLKSAQMVAESIQLEKLFFESKDLKN